MLELKQEIENVTTAMIDAKESLEQFQKDIRRIKNEIADVGGTELREQKGKTNEFLQKFEKVQDEYFQMQAKIDSRDANLQKC